MTRGLEDRATALRAHVPSRRPPARGLAPVPGAPLSSPPRTSSRRLLRWALVGLLAALVYLPLPAWLGAEGVLAAGTGPAASAPSWLFWTGATVLAACLLAGVGELPLARHRLLPAAGRLAGSHTLPVL